MAAVSTSVLALSGAAVLGVASVPLWWPAPPLLHDYSFRLGVQLACLVAGAAVYPAISVGAWGSRSYTWQFVVVIAYVCVLFLLDIAVLAIWPDQSHDVGTAPNQSLSRYGNITTLILSVSFTLGVVINGIASRNNAKVSTHATKIIFNAILLAVLYAAPVFEASNDSPMLAYVAYVCKPLSIVALGLFLVGISAEIAAATGPVKREAKPTPVCANVTPSAPAPKPA